MNRRQFIGMAAAAAPVLATGSMAPTNDVRGWDEGSFGFETEQVGDEWAFRWRAKFRGVDYGDYIVMSEQPDTETEREIRTLQQLQANEVLVVLINKETK